MLAGLGMSIRIVRADGLVSGPNVVLTVADACSNERGQLLPPFRLTPATSCSWTTRAARIRKIRWWPSSRGSCTRISSSTPRSSA
eukprot:6189307-Pleurochrysis_carterae.AAC.2